MSDNREAFHIEMQKHGFNDFDTRNGVYHSNIMRWAWELWQAALAHSAEKDAEIERLKGERDGLLIEAAEVSVAHQKEIARLQRVVDAVNRKAYMHCQTHLNGGVVSIGYGTLKEAQDAMMVFAAAQQEG